MDDKRIFLVSYKMRKYLMIKLINDILFYNLLFEDINIETQQQVSMVLNDISNFSFNNNITTKEEAVFIALILSIIFFDEKEFNIDISNVVDALSPISYNIGFEEKEYNIDMSRVIKALSPIIYNIGFDLLEYDLDTHVDFSLNSFENFILEVKNDISVKTKNKMDNLERITFRANDNIENVFEVFMEVLIIPPTPIYLRDNIKTYGEWLFTLNEITTTKAITNVLFACGFGARGFDATSFNIDNDLQLKGSTSLSLYRENRLYDFDDLELNEIDNSSLSDLNGSFL